MSQLYIIMGVSGSGKSTIGARLSEILKVPFFDGDDFHPKSNIEKMKAGQPLTDHDREPWLHALSELLLHQQKENGAIVACSSLKKQYRQTLSLHTKPTFIFLSISKEEVIKRLKGREKHFMPVELIDSQFDALEVPYDALTIDVNQPFDYVIRDILKKLDSTIRQP
jgi:gluconokinase